MKMIIAVGLGALATVAAVAPASAADGCGRGYHLGPHGHCRPNGAVVVPAPLVVDRYYAGRGYWTGHRSYWHRERWHNGWRYR